MKNIVKLSALVLALVLMVSVFVGCGKTLSGEYSAMESITKSGTVIEFSGKKAVVTVYLLNEEVLSAKATYKIEDDKIEFDFEDIDEDDWDLLEALEDEVSFEELDNGDIKIGGVKYKKQ